MENLERWNWMFVAG